MLMLTQLIGFGARRDAYAPASYVFNGTDEALQRTLSTSGASTTIFTYSMWIKVIAYGPTTAQLFQVRNVAGTSFMTSTIESNGDIFDITQDNGSADWRERCTGLTPDIAVNTWEHWVIRFDSTQATTDNRIRFYRNGALTTDSDIGFNAPALNETHCLFTNAFIHELGAIVDISAFGNEKLAFIEVLDGVSLDASSFAFDNGGTWTRKNYAGSYGTYGFSLDGTDLFNDVSGNGQHFTGLNMDATNLDTADLPPYTN